MAIFDTKKDNKEDKKETPEKVDSVGNKERDLLKKSLSSFDPSSILLKARITEKAAASSEHNAYVFEINPRANKKEVSDAVEKIYNKKPVKVRISPIFSKKVTRRGVTGKTSRGKKAYVYLKSGDSISIM